MSVTPPTLLDHWGDLFIEHDIGRVFSLTFEQFMLDPDGNWARYVRWRSDARVAYETADVRRKTRGCSFAEFLNNPSYWLGYPTGSAMYGGNYQPKSTKIMLTTLTGFVPYTITRITPKTKPVSGDLPEAVYLDEISMSAALSKAGVVFRTVICAGQVKHVSYDVPVDGSRYTNGCDLTLDVLTSSDEIRHITAFTIDDGDSHGEYVGKSLMEVAVELLGDALGTLNQLIRE